jgi:predicted nuclease with RNAse H fold
MQPMPFNRPSELRSASPSRRAASIVVELFGMEPFLTMDTVWIGADPGGSDAFGVAIIGEVGEVTTACVSCADQAVAMISARPAGVGVDAPLWWSSGRSAEREADRWIRRTYGIPAGTVQTPNSLRGAALVQGAMFVQRLRENFPGVPVTETHPKAAAIALGAGTDYISRRSVVLQALASMNATLISLRSQRVRVFAADGPAICP